MKLHIEYDPTNQRDADEVRLLTNYEGMRLALRKLLAVISDERDDIGPSIWADNASLSAIVKTADSVLEEHGIDANLIWFDSQNEADYVLGKLKAKREEGQSVDG